MAKVYGVDRTIRELKQVEPQAVNNLRKDLRSAVEPIALSIISIFMVEIMVFPLSS